MINTSPPLPPHKKKWLLTAGVIMVIAIAGYASYWYFIIKQNFSFDLDLSRGSASELTSTLTLTPSSLSLVAGQDGTVDITIDTAGAQVTAIDLRLQLSGPGTITSLTTTNSSFPEVLTSVATNATSASTTLGVGSAAAGGKTGSSLFVARLAFSTNPGQSGTITISATGTQAAGSGSFTNVLANPLSKDITIVPTTVGLPTASLTATPATIRIGNLLPTGASLSWSHSGTTATIDQSIGTVASSGTRSVFPTTRTTYTITTTNTVGSTIQSVTINVIKVTDANNDGMVNILDYNALISDYGKSGAALAGDLDSNGKVDIFDYNIFVTNYATQKTN